MNDRDLRLSTDTWQLDCFLLDTLLLSSKRPKWAKPSTPVHADTCNMQPVPGSMGDPGWLMPNVVDKKHQAHGCPSRNVNGHEPALEALSNKLKFNHEGV